MVDTSSPRSRSARLVFTPLVILIGAFTVAFLIVPLIQARSLTARAHQEAVAGLATQQPLLAANTGTVREVLAEHVGQPTHSDEILACRLVARGPAWAATGHAHVCTLTARLIYPAPGSPEATNQALAALEDRFGPAQPSLAACPILRSASPVPGLHHEARLYNAGSDADPGCVLPPPPHPRAVTRTIGSPNPAALDRSQGWLVLSLTHEVSATEVGCRFPSVILCEPPVEEPQLP